ncbi:MAG: signal peptidase I [Clostridia bacterium]|nr:signal peptidase I [Clostridia bacterium]
MRRVSILRIVRNVFLIVMLLVIAFTAVVLLSGAKAFAVASDSMAPRLHRGDVVFVRHADFEKLAVGDVISAQFPKEDGIFTHRIVRVDAKKQQVYTRGDHNMSDDPMPTDASHIIGKLWFSLPYLGFISFGIQNYTLIYILLGVAIALIALRFVITLRRKTES